MKIIYTRPDDGGISAVIPVAIEVIEKYMQQQKNDPTFVLTDEEYKAHVWTRSVPADAVGAVEIADTFVFPSREFRNAWKQNGSAIEHDLAKAKEIQLTKIREARAPKLVALDTEYMIADERGDAAAKVLIAKQKQVLRDITEPLKALVLTDIQQVIDSFPALLK